jgi:hypothetical protein
MAKVSPQLAERTFIYIVSFVVFILYTVQVQLALFMMQMKENSKDTVLQKSANQNLLHLNTQDVIFNVNNHLI